MAEKNVCVPLSSLSGECIKYVWCVLRFTELHLVNVSHSKHLEKYRNTDINALRKTVVIMIVLTPKKDKY